MDDLRQVDDHGVEKTKLAAAEIPDQEKKPSPSMMTVRGVLEHYPSNVRTPQAWRGHNFMVGGTPVQTTSAVPEELLKGFVGKNVVVTGHWNPGEKWAPQSGEAHSQRPLNTELAMEGPAEKEPGKPSAQGNPERRVKIVGKDEQVRGDGLMASSVRLLED